MSSMIEEHILIPPISSVTKTFKVIDEMMIFEPITNGSQTESKNSSNNDQLCEMKARSSSHVNKKRRNSLQVEEVVLEPFPKKSHKDLEEPLLNEFLELSIEKIKRNFPEIDVVKETMNHPVLPGLLPSIKGYVNKLNLKMPVTVTSLIYLDRICSILKQRLESIEGCLEDSRSQSDLSRSNSQILQDLLETNGDVLRLPSGIFHKLSICCLSLANKYADDKAYINEVWKTSWFPSSEMNRMEIEILLDFGLSLSITEKDLNQYFNENFQLGMKSQKSRRWFNYLEI